jgi:peptidyl-Asp metalloendopeptidase
MTTTRLGSAAALAVLLACLAPATLHAQPGLERLFSDATTPPGLTRAAQVATTRSRPVRVQTDVLARESRVVLNLFDDVTVVAERTGLDRPRAGSFVWHGRVQGLEPGSATFAVVNGAVAGTVFVDHRVFEVGVLDGVHEVRELDPSAFPSDDPPFDHEPFQFDGSSSPESGSGETAADTGTEIDVMVVWTPNARSAAGGLSAIQSLVDLAVANANAAYDNSLVPTRLRLVYSAEVAYTENTTNISGDLSALAGKTDGKLDGIHGLRDQYGADVVTLIGTGYTSGSNACGIGYLMGSPSTSFASYAFNVVDRTCAAGNLTYAHEVGHNQGLHHDPPNASGTPSYSYAYGYQDPGGAFRTVLSYGSATRVKYLSSPGVYYNGRVTGTGTQDNARALTNTSSTVAAFRPAASGCSYSVSPASLSFTDAGGTADVTITTDQGCSWTAGSSVSWVTMGSTSGSGSAALSVTVAPNGGSARSTTLTIAGQTVSVSQAAAAPTCSYAVSPSSLSFPSAGGSATVSITTSSDCTWSTSSGASWVSVGPGGTGSGSVSVSVSSNEGASRTASVTVAGQAVTVSQAAAAPAPTCSFTVSPTAITLPSSGGTASIQVTTGDGCSWTAKSNTGWLKVSGGGTGSGTATVQLSSGPKGSRTGTATVAGQTVTVTQSGAKDGKK